MKQIHTRKLDRLVAHRNMKKRGFVRVNKPIAGKSFFSENWRKHCYYL